VTLREAERRAIAAALQACGGDKAKSARALGISRTALYDKLKRYGLSDGN
jgi:DNA-binding NtrC family response regulator